MHDIPENRKAVSKRSAISLFLCMAFVCILCAGDTLSELKNPPLEALFRKAYLVLGIAMILAPITAFLLAVGFRNLQGYTFIAEATGVAVFAVYWIVKTWELSKSKLERNLAFNQAVAKA